MAALSDLGAHAYGIGSKHDLVLGSRKGKAMINVKEAVAAAKGFVLTVMERHEVESITLEEVTLSDDRGHWRIVLGIQRPPGIGEVGAALTGMLARNVDYKEVWVDSDDGSVTSMLRIK